MVVDRGAGHHRRRFALIYHDIAEPADRDSVGFPGPVANRYKLDPDNFRAQLEVLAAGGAQFGSTDSTASALLTFDDGGASSLRIADELEAMGWRGVFFVVPARVGTAGFLDADGVRELARRGHEVGSHSLTHPPYMARMNRSEIAYEWRRSREMLSELLGESPRCAAAPGGSVSRTLIEEAAAAGYELLMTSTPSPRRRRFGDLEILGRHTVWAHDRPERAAAYVRGARAPRIRRRVAWEAKSAAKRVLPRGYEALRRVRARRT